MLDKIFAGISTLALIAFTGWVTVRVMEPDLWIVTIIIIGIAIYFIWKEIQAGGSHFEGDSTETDAS